MYRNQCWIIKNIDIVTLNKLASNLIGNHDFLSFSKYRKELKKEKSKKKLEKEKSKKELQKEKSKKTERQIKTFKGGGHVVRPKNGFDDWKSSFLIRWKKLIEA